MSAARLLAALALVGLSAGLSATGLSTPGPGAPPSLAAIPQEPLLRALPSAEAAPRRWPNSEGGPARSGVGAGRPLRSQPERDWSRRVRGEIEDGPLVWNDLVVVSARETAGTRRIYFLDLESGRDVVPALPVATTAPLAPTLWSRAVVLRRNPNELAAFQIGDRRGTPFWSWRSKSAVGPPLALGQDIYATTDEGLVRLRLGRRDPLWVAPGRYRGSVSAEGEHVYAVRYDERGNAALVQLAADTGRETSRIAVGHHDGKTPDPGRLPSIAATGTTLIVHHALPISAGDGAVSTALVQLNRIRDLATSQTGAIDLAGRAIGWRDGYVARVRSGAEDALAVRLPDGSLDVLATRATAPDVLADSAQPARVDSVLYVGRTGVDLVDGRVLWRLPVTQTTRTVPAGNGLLAVVGKDTLEAWSKPATEATESELRRLEASLAAALADRYAKLADEAKRAKDPELLRRLVQSARAWGTSGSRLVGLDQHVELLERQRTLIADDAVRTSVLGKERELEHFIADGLWERAHELATRHGSPDLRYALIEEILRRAPNHPEASAWVRAELPPELRTFGHFGTAAWLGFLRVTRGIPIDVHTTRAPAGPVGAALDDARSLWRRDLIGYESRHLLILTPPSTPPDTVARCLATGELVCAALADVFDEAGAIGDAKLTLHLFPTREEYMRFAQDHVEGGAGLAWTAGHFDPTAELSRIFLPAGVGGWESVRNTYAHELTHHWLHERYSERPGEALLPQPGFWIVEGFASFIEEFTFDLERGEWASENPRSRRLDVVSRSDAPERMDWKTLFEHSQRSFAALADETRAEIPTRWVLGRVELLSERGFFYYQAAAAARALFHAEGGRYRAKLLAYLDHYYSGRASALSVRDVLGLDAEALGRLTLDFAEGR